MFYITSSLPIFYDVKEIVEIIKMSTGADLDPPDPYNFPGFESVSKVGLDPDPVFIEK